MARFFRAGRSGSGAALSDRQKAAIDQRHEAAMQRLGYANHDNQGQTDR